MLTTKTNAYYEKQMLTRTVPPTAEIDCHPSPYVMLTLPGCLCSWGNPCVHVCPNLCNDVCLYVCMYVVLHSCACMPVLPRM